MGVREGLLALLDEGPRYGYQLKTEFEQATGGVWPLNVGQVYTTLDRLQRDGLVEAGPSDGDSTADAQKVYALTTVGREELGAWWEAVPVDEPPPRDELLLKVLMAIDHDPAHALHVVTHHRTVLVQLLQSKRRERKALAGADASLAAQMVTEALVARAEADLRWLDTVEARLTAKASKRPKESKDD